MSPTHETPTVSRALPTGVARWSLWTASFLAGVALVAALPLAGCSGGGGTNTAKSSASVAEPATAAVVSFLDAIKRGDDSAASGMLTTNARTRTQELGLTVAPPVNPTARYEVKGAEVVGDGGDLVHVGTVWTDTDDEGRENSENIVWVVRLDPEGWRVVGMAMNVFDDMPPLLLNFEDPDDMIAKQEMVAEEMKRRAGAEDQDRGGPASGTTTGDAPSAPAVTAQQPAAERRR